MFLQRKSAQLSLSTKSYGEWYIGESGIWEEHQSLMSYVFYFLFVKQKQKYKTALTFTKWLLYNFSCVSMKFKSLKERQDKMNIGFKWHTVEV